MSVVSQQLRKINKVFHDNKYQVLLYFPKVIIFESIRAIRLCNLNGCDEDFEYVTEDNIDNYLLFEKYLWLTLSSGELIVFNILNNAHIAVNFDKTHHKIHQFKAIGKSLYFLSESGETYLCPLTLEQLDEKFAEGISNMLITVKKINKTFLCEQPETCDNLSLSLKEKNLSVKCSITGLEEVISTPELNQLLLWDERVVLSCKVKIWILDLSSGNLHFEFANISGNYHLIGIHNNVLYYVLEEDNEVHICGAWSSSFNYEEESGNISLNSTSQKLSNQDSLKSKLKALVDLAQSNSKASELLGQMQPYFEKIEDIHFLVDLTFELCSNQTSFKPLVYFLQKRVYASNEEPLIFKLKDIINKTDLLQYIYFRNIDYYEIKHLFEQKFKELIILFLSKSDLDIASICWLKYTDTNIDMSSIDVLDILNSIPHNIKLGSLVHWLKNFAPILLDKNPYLIDVFVKWITERVFSLEQSAYWPKIGLKFLDEILIVLLTSLKTVPLRPISLDDLDILKEHLRYIIELKDKYKIKMLLSELSSQSPHEVALIMLRRCYTEDLDVFLQEYLPAFSTRHTFELDETLRTFIESESASGGGNIDGTRLKILLKSFRNHTMKLQCLLQVLSVLDVPWDPTVAELARDIASSTSKDFTVSKTDMMLARDIQKEINYAKVKIILIKYNISLSCTDYMLILHKVVNATTVDLNDLKTITKVMPMLTSYSHLLFINRCLYDCETRSALDYFNNLLVKDKRIVLKSVVSKYEQVINSKMTNPVHERNYLDFLKGTKLLNKVEITALENIYHLKNSFKSQITINSYFKDKSQWSNTIECVDNSIINRRDVFLMRSSNCYNKNYKILKLIKASATSHEVRQIVEDLLTTENNEYIWCQFQDGQNCKLLTEISDVLMELLSSCEEENVHFIIKQLLVVCALINTNIIMKNLATVWKYNYIFLPMMSVTAINDLIEFHNSAITSYTSYTNLSNRSDMVPLRIIANIVGNLALKNEDCPLNIFEVLDSVTKKMLSKIAISQEFDELLTTSLLLVLYRTNTEKDILWNLDVMKTQNDNFPPKISTYLSTAIIRRALSLDNLLTNSGPSYPPQVLLKNRFNIDLANLALSDTVEQTWDVKIILFYVLKEYPNTTFKRLIELCRTLNISVNDGLTLQLVSLLTSWELKYKIRCDDLGLQELHIENHENNLLSSCLVLWESIDNRDFVKEILNDFWKSGEITLHGRIVSINPYFYEVYLCIHHLLFGYSFESRNIKEYYLLHFLKHYTRKSSPKQYEFELFSVKGIFPEIGHYRLPFHLFMREDMWANLKSEITLETYERWLPAGAMLALDSDIQTTRDMICSNALKQTMTSRKFVENETKDNEPWRLVSKEEPLLRAAHRCVKHIANMEWAAACLFYVLQGCARGADQVAAAQLCYQFSQKWATVQPGNRAVQQMERLHLSLSTRHALHKINWACEEFVRLASEPVQLIRAIYLHPDFISKMARYDVNRATNEIADRNGINISSIRIQILENLLEKPNEDSKSKTHPYLNTKELMTAKYILKATCPKMGVIYLSRIAFDEDSEFNKIKQLRALQCLMSVIDTDTSTKVTNRDRIELWSSLLELLYIVNLENIDVPWIVATFVQDKIRALEQLLPNIVGNVEGIRIAAEIAHRYGNVKLIQSLLPLMLRVSLYEEIIPILQKTIMYPDEIVYTAWRSVILSPFQRADYPITERQKMNCLKAINLLPICPIVKDEDLVEVWKNCIRCKNIGLGCLVLPYMSVQTRQTLTELKKVDRRNLIASLKNLNNDTFLVSGAMYVVENMASRMYR